MIDFSKTNRDKKYLAVCNGVVVDKFADFEPAFNTVLNFAIEKIGDRDFKGVSVQIDGKKAFEIDVMGDEYVCDVPVEYSEEYGDKYYSVQHRKKLIDELVLRKDTVTRFKVGKVYDLYNGSKYLYKVISRNKDFVTFMNNRGEKMRRKVRVTNDIEYFYPFKDKRMYGTRIYDALRADSLTA